MRCSNHYNLRTIQHCVVNCPDVEHRTGLICRNSNSCRHSYFARVLTVHRDHYWLRQIIYVASCENRRGRPSVFSDRIDVDGYTEGFMIIHVKGIAAG